MVARVRQDLFRALIAQDTAFFDASKTGELMNRLSADTTGACMQELREKEEVGKRENYDGLTMRLSYTHIHTHHWAVIQNACTSNISMLLRFSFQVRSRG